MQDLLPSLAVMLAMTVVLSALLGKFEHWEKPWIFGALAAHFVAGVAQVLVVTKVYGMGDLMVYKRTGSLLAQFLAEYPVEGSYQLLKAIFQQPDVQLPVDLRHGATGAMQAISGFVMLLVADSLYAACLLIGGLSFFGKVAIYRVFRRELDQRFHRPALIGCLWVPSVVFWSSSLLKEAVALTGLGLAIYGGYAFATRWRPVLGPLFFGVGLAMALPVKAYVVLPLGIAAGVWLYLDGARPAMVRRLRQIRPMAFLVGTMLAIVFVVGIGALFPRFDPAELAETTAELQGAVERTEGGSDYSLGRPEAKGIVGQLQLAPIAILTALFRPTLLDAHNAQSAANALEVTVVTLISLAAVLRCGLGGLIRALLRSPILAFCAVYVAILALGVGLSTTNLGTLSRYRMPLVPFLVVMVTVLASRKGPDELPTK